MRCHSWYLILSRACPFNYSFQICYWQLFPQHPFFQWHFNLQLMHSMQVSAIHIIQPGLTVVIWQSTLSLLWINLRIIISLGLCTHVHRGMVQSTFPIFRIFLSCCSFQWFSPFVLDLTNTFSNQNTKLRGDLACKGWVKANLPISLCNAFLTSLQVNITEGGSCRLYDRPTTGDKPTL